MTPFQLFLAYVKIRGIMPELKKAESNKRRPYWEFDPTVGKHVQKLVTFQQMFVNHFKSNGFGYSPLLSLLYQYQNGDVILRLPKVEKAYRLWSTFVKRNIILDEPLKVGAKVKYRSWGIEHTGVLKKIIPDYSRFVIKSDTGNTQTISPGSILEVDGKPYEFSFHFKWKGKEYGKI